MTRREELERAALAALEQWYAAGRSGAPHPHETAVLTRAAKELIFECPDCNHGGHTCPGCGVHVWHYGPRACSICQDTPRDLAPAQERCWCKRGAEDQFCPVCSKPQHDPISGDLIPAGQDAELEQWGREMAEVVKVAGPIVRASLGIGEPEPSFLFGADAHGGHADGSLATPVDNCLWPETQCKGHRPPVEIDETHASEQPRSAFVELAIEQGIVPASIGRLRGEPDPRWIERTATDVRTGDRVRMPGQPDSETTVIERLMPPQPATRNPDGTKGLPADRNTWHVVPGERGHWDDHVVQPGEVAVRLAGADPQRVRFLPPTMPIEILIESADLLTAIEAFGWEHR